MKLKDYLEDNGVVLWQENSVNGPQQTKSLHMAAQNDFNNASLETLNAAAEILGVKYDKVKRK